MIPAGKVGASDASVEKGIALTPSVDLLIIIFSFSEEHRSDTVKISVTKLRSLEYCLNIETTDRVRAKALFQNQRIIYSPNKFDDYVFRN